MITRYLSSAILSASCALAQGGPFPGGVEDLGNGLAGLDGIPLLEVAGYFSDGEPVQISVLNAARSAPASLIIGASIINFPILGGILVPSPDLTFDTQTDSLGRAELSLTWSAGLSGLYYQWVVIDPAAPLGLAFSNAVGIVGTTYKLYNGAFKVAEFVWGGGRTARIYTCPQPPPPLQAFSSWFFDPITGRYTDGSGNFVIRDQPNPGEVTIGTGSIHGGIFTYAQCP